jgi:hypothetical protein
MRLEESLCSSKVESRKKEGATSTFSVSDVDEGEENDRERESWRKKERVVKKVREKREFVL